MRRAGASSTGARRSGRALELAGPDDVVLLAGKGHETYQIWGTEKRAVRRAGGGPGNLRRSEGRAR